jgi:hypothetical protein
LEYLRINSGVETPGYCHASLGDDQYRAIYSSFRAVRATKVADIALRCPDVAARHPPPEKQNDFWINKKTGGPCEPPV